MANTILLLLAICMSQPNLCELKENTVTVHPPDGTTSNDLCYEIKDNYSYRSFDHSVVIKKISCKTDNE